MGIVPLMVEIAVEMMLRPLTALHVNVLIPPLESQLLCLANFPNGKVMAGVMMATTMLDAPLMVVIFVEMMSRPLTAKSVNVFNKMSSKNSRLTLGTRGKIRIFRINDRQIAGFSHCVKKCTM